MLIKNSHDNLTHQWWWMLKNYIKNKNAKLINDNEFASNHWQCILHSEKVSQAKKLKINNDRKVKYNVTMLQISKNQCKSFLNDIKNQ